MDTQTAIALPDVPGIEKGWDLVRLKPAGQAGQFTAERLATEKRAAILGALGEGMGVRRIARAFEVSTNTVLALRRSAPGEIETQKAKAAGRFADLRDLAVERMIEEIDEMPRQVLPIVAGVATDKSELLRGAPTVRVQHDVSLTVASVADYIDSLPTVQPVDAGEMVSQKSPADVPSVAQIAGPTGSAPIELPAGSVAVVVQAQTPKEDSQSTETDHASEVAGPAWANLGRIEAPKSGRTNASQLRPGAARTARIAASATGSAAGGGGDPGISRGGAVTDGSTRE